MSFLKVLVIGDTATGKTSLVHRMASNSFSESYKATIGCEFAFKGIAVNGDSFNVQLWDLAGQDRLGGLSKLYCRDAHGALIVCDISRPETVGKTAKWKAQLDEYVRTLDGATIPIVLCLNKHDLAPSNTFTTEQLQAVIRENAFSAGFFTSAKTGYNANEALSTIVTLIIKRAAELPPQITMGKKGAMKLKRPPPKKLEESKQCC